MRKALLLAVYIVLLVATLPARAQTELLYTPEKPDPKMARLYDERCMKTAYPDISPRAREEFCACTAAHMSQALTPAQQRTMALGKGAAIDTKMMALKVTAPCLGSPVEDTERHNCLASGNYVHYFKTRQAMEGFCGCVSGHIADYVDHYGPDLMAYVFKAFPGSEANPAALTNAGDYRNEVANWRTKCLNAYAYK